MLAVLQLVCERHVYAEELGFRAQTQAVREGGAAAECSPRWIVDGERLLDELAKDLTERLGRGFARTNLSQMRMFFLTHREIIQTPSELFDPSGKIQTLSEQSLAGQLYAKPPFGGPHHVLHYLARYTHRVAISNHRLVSFAEGKVTFRWKDYAHHNKQRLMTVTAEEFLRRLLLHVLPQGFVRIRFFGFLANRRRKSLLPPCQELLRVTVQPSTADTPQSGSSSSLWRCPRCGGPMLLIQSFTASQICSAFAEARNHIDSS